MRTSVLLVAVLALAGSACVSPGATVPEATSTGGLEEPTFSPLAEATTPGPTGSPTPTGSSSAPTTGASSTPSTAPPTSTTAPTSPTGPAPTPTAPSSSAPATVSPVEGTIADGTGDLEGLNRTSAPAYADLREVRLTMGPDGGTIRIDLASPAPEQGEGDEILNVATYHDVTGDGRVDYEIWASLTADGWGTSWYDLRAGTVRFAAEDDVEVGVEDGTLVLTFPSGHLDGARNGQWLASTEWHTGLMRTTGAAVTDDAPDDRSGRRWPD